MLAVDLADVPGCFLTRSDAMEIWIKSAPAERHRQSDAARAGRAALERTVMEVHFVPTRGGIAGLCSSSTWATTRLVGDNSTFITTFDPALGWEFTAHGGPPTHELELPGLLVCIKMGVPGGGGAGANMMVPSRLSRAGLPCHGKSAKSAPPPPPAAARVERAAARAMVGALAAAALACPTLRGNLPGASLECAAVLAGNPSLCAPPVTHLHHPLADVAENIRCDDVAVLGGVEARGVAELFKAQLRKCVREAEEGRAGAAAERDGEVAVFVDDLLTLLRRRTRTTPLNAAGRAPRDCVPAAWTHNVAFGGVLETSDMLRLNILMRAGERAGARAAALLEPPPLPFAWVAFVVALLPVLAVLTFAPARMIFAWLPLRLLPVLLQRLPWLVRDVPALLVLLGQAFLCWRALPFFALRDFPEAVCRPLLSAFLKLCPDALARKLGLSDADRALQLSPP
jgi:hypothetical protein